MLSKTNTLSESRLPVEKKSVLSSFNTKVVLPSLRSPFLSTTHLGIQPSKPVPQTHRNRTKSEILDAAMFFTRPEVAKAADSTTEKFADGASISLKHILPETMQTTNSKLDEPKKTQSSSILVDDFFFRDIDHEQKGFLKVDEENIRRNSFENENEKIREIKKKCQRQSSLRIEGVFGTPKYSDKGKDLGQYYVEELRKLRATIKAQEEEIVKSKISSDGLIKELADCKKKQKEEISEHEGLIKTLKDQISQQKVELFVASTLIQHNGTDTDKRVGTIKELTNKVNQLTETKNSLEAQLKQLKQSSEVNTDKLARKTEKNKKLKTQIMDYEEVKAKNESLSQEIAKLQNDLKEANARFFDTKEELVRARETANTNEATLRATIEKLYDSLNNTDPMQIEEKTKFKKSLTLRALENPTDKLLDRIKYLEAEKQFFKEEYDKKKRSLEISVKMLEDKEKVCDEIKENNYKEMMGLKEEIRGKVKVIEKLLEKQIIESRSAVKCKCCKKESKPEFIFWQCGHIICSSCEEQNGVCPICNKESIIIRLKFLKKFHGMYETQVKALTNIKDFNL
jgi:myosin heavy subunit